MEKVFIDFEFNRVLQPNPKMYCGYATVTDSKSGRQFWVPEDTKEWIEERKHTHIFVSWSVEAEARIFISLGLDPREYKWYDLYLEYRCLLNHNHALAYGKQLLNGVKSITYAPTYHKRAGRNYSKPEYNLAAACYKLLDVSIDTKHKKEMRDLIISDVPELRLADNKHTIMDYCKSDVVYLPKLLSTMANIYKQKLRAKDFKNIQKDWLTRGAYAASTAWMSHWGYPVDLPKVRNFAASVSPMKAEMMKEITNLFPEVAPFTQHKTRLSWHKSVTNIQKWVADSEYSKHWPKTKTGYSLKGEHWDKHFHYRHDYPKDCFGAQMIRFNRFNQSLNGFLPRKLGAKTKSFFESVGPDERVRPFFNIYGSQSARTQPAATSFMFLKAAWMRALVQPKAGKAMCGIDYGSEEFLISALVSQDKAMLEAYESGDVYLYFAKAAGAVPKDGTREEYEKERDLFKSTTLGISYLMGPAALAKKLTQDTGKFVSEDKAQELIDMFAEVYPDYNMYREEIVEKYNMDGYLQLIDGWTMFGDNDNYRSVANMPIQGMGSVIMRKAVENAMDCGLKIPFTLHDALYMEYDSQDYGKIDTLAKCMDDGFRDCFSGAIRSRANVRLDSNCWGPDYPEKSDSITTPNNIIVKRQQIYIDRRSVTDYNKFQKYFLYQDVL